jgi:hypothetical protein
MAREESKCRRSQASSPLTSRGDACQSWEKMGRKRASLSVLEKQNPRFTGVLEADDGTRTHDLLHGKQTL